MLLAPITGGDDNRSETLSDLTENDEKGFVDWRLRTAAATGTIKLGGLEVRRQDGRCSFSILLYRHFRSLAFRSVYQSRSLSQL